MQNTEQNSQIEKKPLTKRTWLKGNFPLVVGFFLLVGSSFFVGYTVGHKQGLTVVGYDADAAQLIEVVQKQKEALDTVNRNLNMTIQERDIAIKNNNELNKSIHQAQLDKAQMTGMGALYREILRQRGGVSLTVQGLAVRPLPDRVFEYQLDLIQVNPNRQHAIGSAEIRLVRDGQTLVVPMEDKNFSFDQFQRLTGRWTMPEGFVPKYIEVRLNDGGSSPIVRRFSWQKGKPVDAESATIAEIPQAQANSN